jgi:RND family efflux transporter MFP subunit
MKNYINKIKLYVIAHKIISAIIIMAIVGLGYWGYNQLTSTTGEIQYVTTTVQKGTIVSSVTASGQVESSNQVNLTAKVSGTITYVSVKAGDKVTKGQTLFAIDNTDAKKTVRNAEISLQNANLSLKKIKLQNSDTSLNTTLAKAYSDGFNTVTTSTYDLSADIIGLNTILTKENLSNNAAITSGQTAQDYEQKAMKSYYAAQTAFQKTNNDYVKLSNTSSETDIENIIEETYKTTQLLSTAIKDSQNFVDYMAQDSNNTSSFTSYQTTLSGYASTINNDSTSLLSAQTTISDSKDSFSSSDLSIQSAEIAVTQAQNTLQDAKDALSDYYVTAPFSGTIASVAMEVGDTASGTLGSIITTKKIATLSLNEVDVAKIKLGEKATVSFDAISDLTMTGTVAEIDTVGTVSSGVVTYTVKIAFDTENDLVKPGMSVSAAIITDSKTDALIVPSSAIKTQGTTKYVQMFTTPLASPAAGAKGTPSKVAPNKITVTVGISDDTNTEITSGLKEGDQIVSSTITSTSTSKTASTTKSTTSTTKSLLSGGGGGPGM